MGHLVYPCQQTAADDYVYARTYDEKVKTALQQGKKVLLIPENVKGRKTKFDQPLLESDYVQLEPYDCRDTHRQ